MNKAEKAVYEIQKQMYEDEEFFGKSAKNPFYKSKYVPLNDILRIIMPKLLAKECKLKHTMEPTQHAGYGLVTCVVTHISGDKDSSSIIMPLEVHEVSKLGEAVVKLNGQEAGKANTYGRRYSIVPLFAIPEYDDDCEGAMRREPKKDTAKKKKSEDDKMFEGLSKAKGVNRTKDEVIEFLGKEGYSTPDEVRTKGRDEILKLLRGK
jgi:hypothetical protein